MAPNRSAMDLPIEYVKGVGPVRAELLKKELNMYTVEDLLNYFPFRYIDRTQYYHISDLHPELTYVQIRGVVVSKEIVGQGSGRRLSVWFSDGTGKMELVWFQGLRWIEKNIVIGKRYVAFGRLSHFRGSLSIVHPELTPIQEAEQLSSGLLQPVYSSTEKLKSRQLDSRGLARLVHTALNGLSPSDLAENLPTSWLVHYRFPDRFTAYKNIHFPVNDAVAEAARNRFCFEELFFIQWRLACLRHKRNQHIRGWEMPRLGTFFHRFYREKLPFALTEAQKRVLRQIRHDMTSGKQMNRLLQGDVGSGKTIVAFMTTLMVADNGFQSCLMVPTELLAQQHYRTFCNYAEGLGIRVGLLTASIKGKARQNLLKEVNQGDIHVLIGTHALLEENVVFHKLGLSIIDEQHRFGVAQRAALWKSYAPPPHVLVMTATPIPRTLALTIYGDLDQSVIDTLPPGRKPIKTVHRTDADRLRIFGFLQSEIAKGRQVYIVYPVIDESEQDDLKYLMDGYESISRAFPLPEYAISIVHGRMKSEDREYEMQRFLRGETHIMVATTVIEVGVDVPNATVMVIESAERFGLAQLHQLRGRVGRGGEQSYCILVTGPKLTPEARTRIQIMVQTNDGFRIAEEDLKLRGPGDLEGTRQAGILALRIADLTRDHRWLEEARKKALLLLQQDPHLLQPDHKPLRTFLELRHRTGSDWSRVS